MTPGAVTTDTQISNLCQIFTKIMLFRSLTTSVEPVSHKTETTSAQTESPRCKPGLIFLTTQTSNKLSESNSTHGKKLNNIGKNSVMLKEDHTWLKELLNHQCALMKEDPAIVWVISHSDQRRTPTTLITTVNSKELLSKKFSSGTQ
jgi:hypothetical protein